MSVAEGRAFVVSLQEAGLAPSSVAGFVRGLRAFSAWFAAEGLVAEDKRRGSVSQRRLYGGVTLGRLMAITIRTGKPIPLPPMNLRLMKDSDEQFLTSGISLAQLLYRYGLKSDDALIDVGCSVGRVPVGLLAGSDFHGRYLGFDVMKRQVTWAAQNLAPVAADFRFVHLDAMNDRYNPKGKIPPERVRFPARAARFDFCCLFSIFTHFYKGDIQQYLHEIHRVLKPGGLVVATWFLYDDERLPKAVGSPVYPMAHRLDEVTIYAELSDPLRAIAYDENYVRTMVKNAGLEVVRIDRGKWAGEEGDEFQDFVVLRRPEDGVSNSLRTLAGRATGALFRRSP